MSMTDSRNNSGALVIGVVGGVLGGLAAVLLSDDKRRGRVMNMLASWRDQADSRIGDVVDTVEHKARRTNNKE